MSIIMCGPRSPTQMPWSGSKNETTQVKPKGAGRPLLREIRAQSRMFLERLSVTDEHLPCGNLGHCARCSHSGPFHHDLAMFVTSITDFHS